MFSRKNPNELFGNPMGFLSGSVVKNLLAKQVLLWEPLV